MNYIATAVFALGIGVIVMGATSQPVAAAEKSSQPTQVEVSYKYEAQAGDSCALFARKAVQTYGKKFKVSLDQSQILFAETHLTQEAGSPLLILGENITIKESTVKSWVEKAQKLTQAQRQAWYPYTVHVDFNTNTVGQAV